MRIVRFLAIIFLGACLGAALMVHICQPLTLIQENEELQADVAGLSKAYTRRFTRSHIMPFHPIRQAQGHKIN